MKKRIRGKKFISILLAAVFASSFGVVSLGGCARRERTIKAIEWATPVFDLMEREYRGSDNDPAFEVEYSGLNVADKTKVSFGGAFADLSLGEVTVSDGKITVATAGKIENVSSGSIILEDGFFADMGEVELPVKVVSDGACVDQTSFSFSDKFSFDVQLSRGFDFEVSRDDVAIRGVSGVTVASATLSADRKTLTVGVSFDVLIDSINEALTILNKSTVAIGEDIEVPFIINYPRIRALARLEQGDLVLDVRCTNGVLDDLKSADVVIGDTTLDFDGDDRNASLKSMSRTGDNIELVYEIVGASPDVFSGSVSIANGKFASVWGTPDTSFARFAFPLTLTTSSPEDQEDFEEKVISSKLDFDDFSNAVLFAGYVANFAVGVHSGDASKIIGSALSLLQFLGVTGKSGAPTIADVLDKLAVMDRKLDEIDRKIDELGDQVAKSDTALALGIDKVLFNQYEANWRQFSTAYAEKMEDLIRGHQTLYRTKFTSMISSADSTVDVKVNFAIEPDAEDGDKRVVVSENPKPAFAGYSLEGYKITESYDVSIPSSYFEECRSNYLRARGYSDEFAGLFKAAIENYLKDNPNDSYTADDVYTSIVSGVQFDITTEAHTLEFINLFVNYAKGVSGSMMLNYFNMLECLYNFQSEAAKEFKLFRSAVKLSLVRYLAFAEMLADYSGIAADRNELKDVYTAAETFISDHTHLRSVEDGTNYSFVTNSLIRPMFIKATFDKGYNNPGNDCSFFYHFRFYDIGKGMDQKTALDYVNNANLFQQIDLLKIRARYDNLRMYGIVEPDTAFTKYMRDSGVYPEESDDVYKEERRKHYSEGEPLPEKITILSSYSGVGELSSENFKVVCTNVGCGNYFKWAQTRSYKGDKSAGCWSGKEAKGNVLDFESLEIVSRAFDRLARYDESHWYWHTDEHHAFEMYMTGYLGLIFLKG